MELLNDEMIAVEKVALLYTAAWKGGAETGASSGSASSRQLSRLTTFLELIER